MPHTIVTRESFSPGKSARTAWAVAAAVLAGSIFWAKGIAYLYQRHPHEDAFILFRYVEHIASGQGIVFNVGGPRAEGATDFLFLMMLAVLVRLGLDVAVAAVLLNTLGCGLIAFLLSRICTRSNATVSAGLFGLLLAGSIPFLAGANASYDGFGTELYCALVLLGYSLYLDGRNWSVTCTPYLALVLALFRPDGAILGAGFCFVTLCTHLRTPGAAKKLALHGALAVVAGGTYFIWRYRYFGELLPLPLYVKSRGVERLPGLPFNEEWFNSGNGPWPLLMITSAFVVALALRRVRSFDRALLGTIPVWLLIAGLMFAYQSQNVDFRFQAPAYTVLMAAMIAVGAELFAGASPAWLRALVLAAWAIALTPALREGKKIWPLDYMDGFAVRLGRILGHETMALTEAGRMAYWSTATVYDMVGLNTPYTAKHPPSVAYLEALNPDIVMFHAAGTIDFNKIPVASGAPQAAGVIRVDGRLLPGAVQPWFQGYLRAVPEDYRGSDLPTKIAPVVMNLFLATHPKFDVFAVRYNNNYTHIFGVKRDGASTRAVEDAILRSYEQTYLSYAEAKHFSPSLADTIVRRLSRR